MLTATSAPAEAQTLANRCFTLSSHKPKRFVVATADGYTASARSARTAERFFLKPTGLGTYLLHDREGRLLSVAGRAASPGPDAEWLIRRARTLSSTSTGADLAVDSRSRKLVASTPGSRFRFRRARGCRPFAEAEVGASGRPFRSRRRQRSVFGIADVHMHVTADLRAGGSVIYGKNFDRFGIPRALGHDEEVHGQGGSMDFTGNLLRSGTPTGSHDTRGWPAFTGWPTYDTYTHQQVYYRWLERMWMAGLRLLVAQAVEDEPLCRLEPFKSHSCDETETIELQVRRLRELQDYVDAQSGGRGRGWFRLVYSSAQARRVIRAGRLAVVIGAESSNPFGCSQYRGEPACDQAAIDRGIDRLKRLGVRSLFPAHWVDNALSGAALEGATRARSSPP